MRASRSRPRPVTTGITPPADRRLSTTSSPILPHPNTSSPSAAQGWCMTPAPAAGAKRPGARVPTTLEPAAAARTSRPSRHGRRIYRAASGCRRMSRPWPIRPPAWPSTAAPTAAGSSTAVPARPRRSSPRCTPWPRRPRPPHTRPCIYTRTPPTSTTSWVAATMCGLIARSPTTARGSWATTVPPALALRTAPRPSGPTCSPVPRPGSSRPPATQRRTCRGPRQPVPAAARSLRTP